MFQCNKSFFLKLCLRIRYKYFIYSCESKNNCFQNQVIEACDLHGNNRRILVGDVPHPYGIAVTNRHIYWTDWSERSILRVSKHTGRNAVNICSNLPNLMDMHNIQLNHTGTYGDLQNVFISHLFPTNNTQF